MRGCRHAETARKMIGRAARCRCRTGARSSPTTRGCGPSRACPRSASTSPTTRSRSGRRPRRRRAQRRADPVLGVRLGRRPGDGRLPRGAPRRGPGPDRPRLRDRQRARRDRGRACRRGERARGRHRPVRRGRGRPQRPGERRPVEYVVARPARRAAADVEVLLAADTWYEGPFAERVRPWLQAAADRGIRVLVGDPGRRYLPERLARGARRVRGRDDDPARGSRRGDTAACSSCDLARNVDAVHAFMRR